MKDIIKHLRSFAVIVPLCLVLIFTQAMCELNIPALWGDLIDIGLRQNGLGAGAPEAISRRGMELLQVFMTDSDKEFFEGAYYTYEPESTEAQRIAAQYPLALQESVCVMRADVWGLTRARADSVYADAARAIGLYLEQDGSEEELENLRKKYELAKKQAAQGVFDDPVDPSDEGVIGKIPDGAIIAGLEGLEDMSVTTEVEPSPMTMQTGSNLMDTQEEVFGTESGAESGMESSGETSAESSVESAFDAETAEESKIPEHIILDEALAALEAEDEAESEADKRRTQLGLSEYYDLLPLLQALPAESTQEAIKKSKTDASAERVGSSFKNLFYEEVGVNVAPIRSAYITKSILKLVAAVILSIVSLILACVLAEKLSDAVGKKLLESLESRVESFEEESTIHLVARASNDIIGVQKLADLLIRLALYVPLVLIGGTVFASKSALTGAYTAILIVLVVLCAAALAAVAFMPRLLKNEELAAKLRLNEIESFLKKLAEKLLGGNEESKIFSKKWLLKLGAVGVVAAVTAVMSLVCAIAVPSARGAIESAYTEVGMIIEFIQHAVQLIAASLLGALLLTSLRNSFPALLRIKEALFPAKAKEKAAGEKA